MNEFETTTTRDITVRLFAAARDQAGAETLVVRVPISATVQDVRRTLETTVPALQSLAPHLLFAIGSSYVHDDDAIADAGEVVAFPPVSGG